jgi:hypothetical protein
VSALALAVCLAVAERAVAQGEQEVEELTAVEATEEPKSQIQEGIGEKLETEDQPTEPEPAEREPAEPVT